MVDRELKLMSLEYVLDKFKQLNESTKGNITSKEMKKFVYEHFSPPGSELDKWIPSDWTSKYDALKLIRCVEVSI